MALDRLLPTADCPSKDGWIHPNSAVRHSNHSKGAKPGVWRLAPFKYSSGKTRRTPSQTGGVEVGTLQNIPPDKDARTTLPALETSRLCCKIALGFLETPNHQLILGI